MLKEPYLSFREECDTQNDEICDTIREEECENIPEEECTTVTDNICDSIEVINRYKYIHSFRYFIHYDISLLFVKVSFHMYWGTG